MSDLFLNRIELSNFRVYGASYVLDLAPRPGVTLVVGGNGLGKTTLFDGIEWTLTGDVSRFADLPGDGRRRERDPLTRLGAPEGSHRVSLQFNQGGPIERGQDQAPETRDLLKLLKRPEWPEIGNLHSYLAITHFLGQASSKRFSVRKPKEQWEALKGPAGVDRINQVKERIGGQAPRQAFTRVIKEATDWVVAAEAELEAWVELRAERDRLQKLSSSEDALSPEALVAAANQLAARVVQLVEGLDWTEANVGEPPEALLGRLARVVAMAIERSVAEADRLGGLEAPTAEFTRVVADMAAQTALVRETEGRLAELAELTRAATAELSAAEDSATEAERRLVEADAQVAAVTRAATAAAQLADCEARLKAEAEALAASDAASQAAASREAELRQQLADVSNRLDQRRRLSEQLALARTRLDLVQRWQILQSELRDLLARAAAHDAEALQKQRAEQVSVQTERESAVRQTRAALRALDERQTAVAEAVAAIASRLTEADTHCPVCATQFAAGRLAEIARSRPTGRSGSAVELASRLADQELALSAVNEAVKTLDEVIEAHTRLLTAVAEKRAVEANLRQQLAEAGAVDGVPEPNEVTDQIAALQGQIAALDEVMEREPSAEVIGESLAEVTAELQAEATRRTAASRRRSDALASAEAARGVLRQSPTIWNAETGLLVDLDSARSAAQSTLDVTADELGARRAQREALRLKLEDLRGRAAEQNAALSSANGRLDQATARRQAVVDQWLRAGMSGDPDAVRVAALLATARERLGAVESLSGRQKRLTEGYRRWTEDEALAEVQGRIAERRLGDEDEAAVTARLRSNVTGAQKRLDTAQRARSRMEEVVAELQEKADDYAEGVLQPLNDTIRRFSRALMTWSDAAIVYRAEHLATRSELRPSAVRTDADGRTHVLDINPNMFFSEGQLSALSVSALLAASTSFPWSRWRGLLMDDPLQHNDVIHASAFMDLMRQMVRQLGYQVIMSTHDSAEAAFLIRKCETSGVPFSVHELQPPGDDGLISAAA